MLMKRLLILICVIALSSGAAVAQKGKLARANKAFEQLNYQGAIEQYLSILDKGDVDEAKMRLADCYRHLGNYIEAEYWYGQVVRLPSADVKNKFYYAQALQVNGKCEVAKQWVDEYISERPDDQSARLLAKACEEGTQNNLMQKNAGLYTIEHLDINSSLDDFGTAFYGDGIVFASEREKGASVRRIHTWTGNAFLELFYSGRNTVDESTFKYSYDRPVKQTFGDLNTRFHDAIVSFNADQSEVFYSRNHIVSGKACKDQEGTILLQVVSAVRKADSDKFGEFQSMPFNSCEYNTAHPSLSRDGKRLYFSSDMPGGFGGMDLYVSELENGRWSPPVNLGPAINTERQEVFPHIDARERFWFASDGHAGLGGLDNYYADLRDGTFGPVVNAGFPLNSRDDDFALVMNEDATFGYFSSDRAGGNGGDDIYSFRKTAVDVEVLVYDEKTGAPVPNATVTMDCNDGTVFKTGDNGRFTMELPIDKCCAYDASANTYLDNNEVSTCSKGYDPGSRLFAQIPLRRPEPVEPPTVLRLEGVAYDKSTGRPLPGVLITLVNDCGEPEQTTRTDASGAYGWSVSEGCCYQVKGTDKRGYFNDVSSNACTHSLKSQTIQRDVYLVPFLNDKGQSLTFKLEHIYYDFDQDYIRDDAMPQLNELVQLMRDNPTLIVEIGSHTDARASFAYNEDLSTRRARSAVRYLIERGITSNRLVAKGYGETQLTNGCANNVECSEEEHQLNRRTEFRIIGDINGERYDVRSSRPADIKIDPADPNRKWTWE